MYAHQPVSRQTVGLLGAVGALLLLVWAVGFFAFGAHAHGWHLLLPVGAALIIAQGVRRLNDRTDDPD